MLGRFVVPSSRLPELVEQLEAIGATEPLDLSVLSSDWLSESEQVVSFANEHANLLHVGAIEQPWRERLPEPGGPSVYVETSLTESLEERLTSIKHSGCHAKIRMGGLDVPSFPDSRTVLEFLQTCGSLGLAFKATAGLHHPFPAARLASNDDDAPIVPMHGFVNMLLAMALLRHEQADETLLLELLGEQEASAFVVDDDGIRFRDQLITRVELETARARFHSIGSCSFDVPLHDLQRAGWLAPLNRSGERDGA